LGYYRVGCKKRDPFDHRLRNQDTVEGIFMYGRKSVGLDCVLAQDRQLFETIVEHRAAQDSWIKLKALLSKGTLDCNFP